MYQLEQFGIDSSSHQDCNQCLVNFHTASDVPVMGLKVQERGQCCQGKKKKGREKMEGKKTNGMDEEVRCQRSPSRPTERSYIPEH